MKRFVLTLSFVGALAAVMQAQDSTVKSKTKIDGDDVRTVVMRGCLQQAIGQNWFTLRGIVSSGGDDVTVKSKTKTDHDQHGVTTKTRTEVDGDHASIGTAGTRMLYEISPNQGVDLIGQVGHEVEVVALMPTGRGDAKAKITEQTTREVPGAPDTTSKSKTKVELPKGPYGRMTAISVKPLGAACTTF